MQQAAQDGLLTVEEDPAETAAADWFLRLREDPREAHLRSAFEAWMAADIRHRDAWSEMLETARMLGSAQAKRGSSDRSRGFVRRTLPALSAAAAAACILISMAPRLFLALQADVATGAGEVRSVRLDDGSSVAVGPQSAIAISYTPGARTVRLLSGQASFEVTHDPARPFRVETKGLTTTVLGTGFDVRRLGEDIRVEVRHGRVRIDGEAATPALRRELTAGQWVRMAQDGRIEQGAESPDLIGLWQSGTVSIQDRSIADAIDELRPWYNGVILASGDLGSRHVTGAYDFRDPARSLSLLVAPYGGRVYQVTPWLMVVTGGR